MVVFGEEPLLRECAEAILRSNDVDAELIIVENGGSESTIKSIEEDLACSVIRPGHNTGFALGCNLGVARGDGEYVALVNPDAIVDPGAIRHLVDSVATDGRKIVTASIRLMGDPTVINSAGTEISILGVSWAARFGDLADPEEDPYLVAGANGGALLCARAIWEELEGLESEMFAYYEDADLSIRAWQRGIPTEFVPTAVTVHDYHFSKNQRKYYLLERNRLISILTCFETRYLLLTLPLHIAGEMWLVLYAARNGWIREKMAAYVWLVRHRGWLLQRRRRLRERRTASLTTFYDLLTTSVTPANLPGVQARPGIERILEMAWTFVRRLGRF